MERTLTLPRISEVQTDATVTSVAVRPGDFVKGNQAYAVIDTEKALIELPAPYDCIVLKVHVRNNDKIQQGEPLVTVDPRDDLGLCAIREERGHVATGLMYLTTRTALDICDREEHGRYRFDDLVPFVEQAISLAHVLRQVRLETIDEADVVELRDTLYHLTQLLTRIESFGSRGAARPADYTYILRAVSDYQDTLLRRLLRAVDCAGLTGQIDVHLSTAVYNPTKAYVFISHHHTDARVAAELANRLKEEGVAHFVDDVGIPWGDPIPRSIHIELGRASHIVVIMTPGSVKSAWVAYEVGFARGARKKIVPYPQHPSMELPGFMSDLRQLRSLPDAERFIAELQHYRRSPQASTDRG